MRGDLCTPGTPSELGLRVLWDTAPLTWLSTGLSSEIRALFLLCLHLCKPTCHTGTRDATPTREEINDKQVVKEVSSKGSHF